MHLKITEAFFSPDDTTTRTFKRITKVSTIYLLEVKNVCANSSEIFLLRPKCFVFFKKRDLNLSIIPQDNKQLFFKRLKVC